MDVDFLPTCVWQGLFCSASTVIFTVTDDGALMQYVTRHVKEIFSVLINVIFVVESLKSVLVSYDKSESVVFLTTMLCFGTYILAIKLKTIMQKNLLIDGCRFTIRKSTTPTVRWTSAP